MPTVNLNSKLFSYTLTLSRRRSMALRPKTRRSFAVFAPLHTPNFLINRFISSHASWIVKACSSLSKVTKLSSKKSLTILDQNYKLVFIKTSKDSLIIDHDNLQIFVNTPSFSSSHLKQLYNSKLRPLSLKLIAAQLSVYRAQFGFDYGKVTVKNQSTRLGSCSSQGNLSFNWQIIFLPVSLFNHILLHELTHLKVKNHSSRFWNQLSVYDPSTLTHRRLLRSKGTSYFLV
ncbi:MAG: SprT family zinc-dependent metalloprotease [Candidatus Shapirobacteria bacterium]